MALALVALLACGGCGTSDEQQAREAVEQLQRALRDRDAEAACELTTRAAHEHLGNAGHRDPTTCRRDVRAFAAGVDVDPGDPRVRVPVVESVTVDGDSATATLRLGDRAMSRLPLAKEDGDWKVDAFYGELPAGRQEDRLP